MFWKPSFPKVSRGIEAWKLVTSESKDYLLINLEGKWIRRYGKIASILENPGSKTATGSTSRNSNATACCSFPLSNRCGAPYLLEPKWALNRGNVYIISITRSDKVPKHTDIVYRFIRALCKKSPGHGFGITTCRTSYSLRTRVS